MIAELITLPDHFSKVVVDGKTVARIDALRDTDDWRITIDGDHAGSRLAPYPVAAAAIMAFAISRFLVADEASTVLYQPKA